jgi:hypothetical protein
MNNQVQLVQALTQAARTNQLLQQGLLAELRAYNWLDANLPDGIPMLRDLDDLHAYDDMLVTLFGYPFVLHLTDNRMTGQRVWYVAYNSLHELITHVLTFATCNLVFYNHVSDAYFLWLRSGNSTLWDSSVFFDELNKWTYFTWGATPNFDVVNVNENTPAARTYSNLLLDRVLRPPQDLAESQWPEFYVLEVQIEELINLNVQNGMDPNIPRDEAMYWVRMARFLMLGYPLATYPQAIVGLLQPLHLSHRMPIPHQMVRYAQDIDLLVQADLRLNRQPAADMLMASSALRAMSVNLIPDDQLDLSLGRTRPRPNP